MKNLTNKYEKDKEADKLAVVWSFMKMLVYTSISSANITAVSMVLFFSGYSHLLLGALLVGILTFIYIFLCFIGFISEAYDYGINNYVTKSPNDTETKED